MEVSNCSAKIIDINIIAQRCYNIMQGLINLIDGKMYTKNAQMRTYNTSHFFLTFYLIRALIFLFKIQDGERAARVFVRTRVVLLSNIFMIDEF